MKGRVPFLLEKNSYILVDFSNFLYLGEGFIQISLVKVSRYVEVDEKLSSRSLEVSDNEMNCVAEFYSGGERREAPGCVG